MGTLGRGTPKQVAKNGCGAAVLSGIADDFGQPVKEGVILRRGYLGQRPDGQRIFAPASGIDPEGLKTLAQDLLPDGVTVATRYLGDVGNHAGEAADWLARNGDGALVAGVMWDGAGTGTGHWVRVEAVRDGFVYLGDPGFARGISVKVPQWRFNRLARFFVEVTP